MGGCLKRFKDNEEIEDAERRSCPLAHFSQFMPVPEHQRSFQTSKSTALAVSGGHTCASYLQNAFLDFLPLEHLS